LAVAFAVVFGALFTTSRRGFCVGAARLIETDGRVGAAFLRQPVPSVNGFESGETPQTSYHPPARLRRMLGTFL
jgi:hypothetical protein